MEHSEQVKKEAHDVVKLIDNLSLQELDAYLSENDCIKLAIQDRQSVLDENKSVLKMLKIHGDLRTRLPIHDRIQSLTQQIEYLKSKI